MLVRVKISNSCWVACDIRCPWANWSAPGWQGTPYGTGAGAARARWRLVARCVTGVAGALGAAAGAVVLAATGERAMLAARCIGAGCCPEHPAHAAMADASKTNDVVVFPMPRRRPGGRSGWALRIACSFLSIGAAVL